MVRGASIFVSDLRLEARVGVDPGEQGAEQAIVVDIWVGIEDIERPARSEKLRDTTDYVAVARTVRRVVERRHYPLVESLAIEIAQAVLAKPGARWVRLRLRKLDCLRNASAAGVEVELSLDQSETRPEPVRSEAVAGPEEIVVVGGGAAGLAAMLWCWRLGHPALLLDPAPLLGGQLHLVHGIMSDLPAMNPMDGAALARRLWRQFVSYGGRWLQAKVQRVATEAAGCTLTIEEAAEPSASRAKAIRCRTVILATGVRRRGLGVPGEQQLAGRGILGTAARGVEVLAGQRAAVVGGGDSACENALILARAGARVTLVHRGARLGGRDQFAREVQREPRIEVRLQSRVVRFLGQDHLEAVEISSGGRTEIMPVEAALVRVGWIPNSEAFPEAWLDPEGYVETDPSSHVRGEALAFAAGDVLGRLSPSVATAFGSAATAARAAALVLEGSTAAER